MMLGIALGCVIAAQYSKDSTEIFWFTTCGIVAGMTGIFYSL